LVALLKVSYEPIVLVMDTEAIVTGREEVGVVHELVEVNPSADRQTIRTCV